MNNKLYDRCIRCGSEQEFHIYEGLVKCRFCGHTFAVTKFQSEQARINKALEEGEAAQAALAQAEKERDEAQQRLNHVVAALDRIAESQVDEDAQLKALFKEVQADRETEEAIRDLLHGMQADQKAGVDELTRLMLIMSESQSDAGDKLKLIGEIAGKILKGQDSILSRMSMQAEIAKILQDMRLENAERDRVAEDFLAWSQSVHAEDITRLEAIQRGSNYLVESQRTIDNKLEGLRDAAQQTQKAIETFQKEYQADKIKELNNLYRQAEDYQYDRRFDKAEEKYYEVIQKGGADAAVYWRILLCHYCVEYQEDENGNRIPTILNPDLSEPEEMSIRKKLKKSIGTGEAFYQGDLAEIDRILDKYRKLRHTVQYDVFISVKQDINGHYTEDSDVASELYHYIKNQGLRVFNSRITKIPLGQKYEPYIIAALMSARIMIVVGSSAENMNSKWVRNEWKRFQWLQYHEKKEHGNRVLFCYLVGMRPDEIPRGLDSAQQHLMSGSIDSESRLLDSLKAVFPEKFLFKAETRGKKVEEPMPVVMETVLQQMTIWSSRHQYDKVLNRYDELTDQGLPLDRPEIHLWALCAERHLSSIEQLVGIENLSNQPLFVLARRVSRGREDELLFEKLLNKTDEQLRHNSVKREIKKENLSIKEVSPIGTKANGYYKYKVERDNTITITQYCGDEINVMIPSTIDGYKVQRIGSKAFENAKRVGSITLPFGVKAIEAQAFSNCESLLMITLPNSLEEIGDRAFQNCTNLPMLSLPGTILSIGENPFIGCVSLAYFDVKVSETIGVQDRALVQKKKGCLVSYPCGYKAEDITVQNIITIGKSAFCGNQSIRRIKLSMGVTRIEDNAFSDCSMLEEIVLPSSIKYVDGSIIRNSGKCRCLVEKGSYIDKYLLDNLSLEDRSRIMHPVNIDLEQLIKRAEEGDNFAQLNLAELYDYGEVLGDVSKKYGIAVKDHEKARQWYLLAVGDGQDDDVDIGALWRLGHFYASGDGGTKDIQEAAKWYNLAIKRSDKECLDDLLEDDECLDDLFSIGMAYRCGNTVSEDQGKAIEWLVLAEKHGSDRAKEELSSIRHALENSAERSVEAQVELGRYYKRIGDKSQAAIWFRKAAEKGYAHAQFELGMLLESNGNPECVKWYHMAAEQEDTKDIAATVLAGMYKFGHFVSKDMPEAVKWMTIVAEMGYPVMQYELAMVYYSGEGIAPDKEKAVYWLREARKNGNEKADKVLAQGEKKLLELESMARKGDVDAQRDLGQLFDFGDLMLKYDGAVHENKKWALHWYIKSCEQEGITPIEARIGQMLLSEEGAKKSIEQAAKWFTRAMEDSTKEDEMDGFIQDIYSIACAYYNGEGISVNKAEAFKWCRIAAEKGYLEAQCNLARMYYHGDGVPTDKNKAIKWYKVVANQGHLREQMLLANIYENGDGVAVDKVEAVKWYTQAAEQGNTEAQIRLGRMLYEGNDIKTDKSTAQKWLKKAAEQGHVDAQIYFGIICYNDHDYPEAVKWIEQAANKGNVYGQYYLGRCFFYGDGVVKDVNKALLLFTAAAPKIIQYAEQGDAAEQYYAGNLYYNGWGVEKDKKTAQFWFEKAAKMGMVPARVFLKKHMKFGKLW